MNKAFQNILAICLAVLVLFSTFSFTVEKHLCGGEVAGYSFIGNLEGCEMPNNTQTSSEKPSLTKTPCCQDVVETIESTNDELSVIKELKIQQIKFVAIFISSYVSLFDDLEQNTTHFKEYKPPSITKDIPVIYNSFLIWFFIIFNSAFLHIVLTCLSIIKKSKKWNLFLLEL